MFKKLQDVVKILRLILKYSSLIVVVLGILTFSADSLEKWGNENLPKDDKGSV